MKNYLSILCLCFFCHTLCAQDWYNDPQPYDGVVVLDDRSTLRGVFSYNQSNEHLSFKNGQQVTASEALYFQFYDPDEKYNRYFFSHINEYHQYKFYEVLLNGKILVYGKSILKEKDYVDHHNNKTTIFIDKKVVEAQLYFNDNDTLIAIMDFEKQILPLMKDRIQTVSSYIFSEKLDIAISSDQLVIIDHYNQQFPKKLKKLIK